MAEMARDDRDRCVYRVGGGEVCGCVLALGEED